jgi:acetyl-CoA acyltransferase
MGNEAYIVRGYRTAVGKANRGGFKFTRPDDLAVKVIQHLLSQFPQLDLRRIDDMIVGNAVPEAEQGLQMGRMISVRLGIEIPGFTINRYCASGLEAIAIATAKVRSGMADCIIAGGTESMSLVPTVGWRTVPNYEVAKDHADYYAGMGLTAEAVANKYKISREDADNFSVQSHVKAANAIDTGKFKDEIVPFEVEEVYFDGKTKKSRKYIVDTDEGVRRETTLEGLGKLKPVFAVNGTVTAGNSSQTSDGASFCLIMSERMIKELNITPDARLVSCSVAGVEPIIMGIGPCAAIPKALSQANLKLENIDLIELNEAFAAQSLAVIQQAGLNPDIINVNGGAIALGHPLGCSGSKLSVQLINEMRRRNQKYGMVTACVGGGQGIAGIIERLN